MYEISKTGQFKKDFKLIMKRGYDIEKLESVLEILLTGQKLPAQYFEHSLSGSYKSTIDCHIEPDWLLLFRRNDKDKVITLVRTGTHSDLF